MKITWKRPSKREDELDAEIRNHLDEAIQERIERGESPDVARASAMREFGNVGLVKDVTREIWGWTSLERLRQDLNFGWRMLLKNRGFTLVAIFSLALGIGVNTAVFTVVNAALLRPLPYTDAKQIVRIFETTKATNESPISPLNFIDWRSQSQTLGKFAAFQGVMLDLIRPDGIEPVPALRVSADLFPLLGVTPLHGRTFLADEDRPGAANVVLLSHSLWMSQFGGDVKVVGQSIRLGETSATVIGVLPPDFEFQSSEIGLWVPLAIGDASHRMKRTERYLQAVGRIHSGFTLEEAQSEMNAIAARLAQAYPDANASTGLQLIPLQQFLVKRSRLSLLVLLGAVGIVLLIACANIANLLLARGLVRHKELAIRTALGASRLRVTRQLLTENLMLSLIGGSVGLLLAYISLDLLIVLLRSGGNDFAFAIARLQRVGVDSWVLGFTLLVSLATGLVFGLTPIWQHRRLDLNGVLKGLRGNAGKTRFRQAIVIAQTGLTVVLLVSAGLLLKSFWRLSQVDLGFDAQHLVTMQITAPTFKPDPNSKNAGQEQAEYNSNFFRSFIGRLKSAPGVIDAGLISFAPLTSESSGTRFTIEHRPPATASEVPTAGYRVISPGYFTTMRVPLLHGRDFSDADRAHTTAVMIINETMARRFWPGGSALNQRIRRGGIDGFGPWYTVVGVVKDVKTAGPDSEVGSELYIPHAQFAWPQMTLVARTLVDPKSGAHELHNWIRASDRSIKVTGVRSMDELVGRSRATRWFNLLLLGTFASVALLLAGIGVYGVVSYSVAQRTHEIGIRLALGAGVVEVRWLIVRQGLWLVIAGIVFGLIGSYTLTRALTTLLFEVSPTDPLIYLSIPLLLFIVTLLSCLIPAHRAARINPLRAMRHE